MSFQWAVWQMKTLGAYKYVNLKVIWGYFNEAYYVTIE